MRKPGWAAGLLVCILASEAGAQPRLRQLEVPPAASWQHSQTSVILPATLAGLPRTGIQDTGSEELDVIATYESPDQALTTTIYIFRSQVPSVPLWFDRSRTVLEQLKRFPIANSGPLPARSFAPAAGQAESALRVAYPLSGGGYAATGLAVVPLNGWIMKVRMSSKSLGAEALDAKLASLVAAVRWPKNMAAAPAAAPVEPCPTPLLLKRAKMIKPDVGQALIGSLLAMAGLLKAPPTSTLYCRDAEQGVPYGVYRAAASTTGYLVALADSGRAISVGVAPNLEERKDEQYSVTLLDLGSSSVYPSFNRLPPPKQVMEVLSNVRPLSSSKVGSTTVSISPSSIR
jgi:hypothetical protein